jgi:uncharacterized protein YyaL (SSP411 family)
MERQCFENEQIAQEMNRRFVNIKVDREERPDVDQLYMTAVQVLTRQGGWPMSVFLTPDLRPFYGGTYFPPTDMPGRPGFLTLLRAIDGAYHERPEEVQSTCARIKSILLQLAEPQRPETPVAIDRQFVHDLVNRSTADYDARDGGFGAAPKFPRQTLLELLLVHVRQLPPNADPQSRIEKHKSQILKILIHTLDAMADGGIHDQLGGAFHRYSTDAQWLIPHFEIMLYDNAMLGWIYTEAYRQSQHERYAQVARGIFDFVLREMTSPQGAFYTAFDAEVDAQEGLSYLWAREEILAILGPKDGATFNHVYGVDRGPNFADPHHGNGIPDKNILYLPRPKEAVAKELGMSVDELDQKLAPMRQKLYDARRQRKQPLLDTKIITSWNALAIRAMAYASKVLNEPRYAEAARRAGEFLLTSHVMPDGRLVHNSMDRVSGFGNLGSDFPMPETRYPKPESAFLDDYAFLVQSLLELHDSLGDDHWKRHAADLNAKMIDLFLDKANGGFYFVPSDARDIIVRQKVAMDSPLPSGNAVAVMNCLALDRSAIARDALALFAGQLESSGEAMSAMVQASSEYLARNEPISVGPGPWRVGSPPTAPQQTADEAVSLHADWAAPDKLHLRVGIQDGFHINAHEAAKGLVATQLSVQGGQSAAVERIDYPPGEERRLADAEDSIRVYSGEVTIAVQFKRNMQGSPPLSLGFSYQACNDNACFTPAVKQMEVNAP